MNKLECPVCYTKCNEGATDCAKCGFFDILGINRNWLNVEDGDIWVATVVKSYRQQWEFDIKEAELLARIDEMREREKKLWQQLETAQV